MQTDSNLTILDSAVDWLTVTAKRGDDSRALLAVADGLLHQSVSNGNYVHTFQSKGYQGMKAGGVTYGKRYDGAILTLTSSEAASNSRALLGGVYHVTRLDLQITCSDETRNPARAEIAYHLMQESTKRAGRPVRSSLRLNSSGGQTLYLGSPKSDILARLYDKGVEKKVAPPGWLWRLETQYRREPAERVARKVYQSETINDCIAALVVTHFSYRGVVTPPIKADSSTAQFQYEGLYFSKRESDHDKSLRWLSTFVRPSIKRLIRCGKRKEVLQALGLLDDE